MRRNHVALLVTCCMLIWSCAKDPIIGLEAEAYLNGVMDVMQAHSINKTDIDWTIFRSEVISAAGPSQLTSETNGALTTALTLLGDNHSSIIRNDTTILIGNRTVTCSTPIMYEDSIPVDIGYIQVGSFSSGDPLEMVSFADSIQSLIRDQDKSDLRGWIVDLRGNLGGNMWPMIAGLGPILGEGVAGHFIYPDNTSQSWSYSDGGSYSNESSVIVQATDHYELINPNPKIAVLTDRAIASSGEVMVISFIGMGNAKSFGQATCGLSTSNQSFQLSDGSILNLTTAYLGDRNLTKYGSSIVPEVVANQNAVMDSVYVYFEE